jgi:hypothetical protein
MLLSIIHNLPRVRFSVAMMKLIIWLLKECGVRGVPSLGAFQKMEKSLQAMCRFQPQTCKTARGNIFTVNDPASSFKLVAYFINAAIFCLIFFFFFLQDMANPAVAKHIQLYPEVTNGAPISEVWQASRWKEFQRSELNPMYASGLSHFYVGEIAQLDTGELVIPDMWYTSRQGQVQEVHAECFDVFDTGVCVWSCD